MAETVPLTASPFPMPSPVAFPLPVVSALPAPDPLVVITIGITVALLTVMFKLLTAPDVLVAFAG